MNIKHKLSDLGLESKHISIPHQENARMTNQEFIFTLVKHPIQKDRIASKIC